MDNGKETGRQFIDLIVLRDQMLKQIRLAQAGDGQALRLLCEVSLLKGSIVKEEVDSEAQFVAALWAYKGLLRCGMLDEFINNMSNVLKDEKVGFGLKMPLIDALVIDDSVNATWNNQRFPGIEYSGLAIYKHNQDRKVTTWLDKMLNDEDIKKNQLLWTNLNLRIQG